MSTSNPSAKPEPKKPDTGFPDDTGSSADVFVVGAFLVCAVIIVLYCVGSFVARLWS